LIRLPRIAKFYKMLKLFRMVKILKLVKNKEKIKSQMSKSLQLDSGIERLSSFLFLIIFAEHIFACFWLIIGTEEVPFYRDTWYNPSIVIMSSLEKYILSFYFVTTTMTTVGYGDMSGATEPERVYLIIMMLIGVFIFATIQGSLTSILASYDTSNAESMEKM